MFQGGQVYLGWYLAVLGCGTHRFLRRTPGCVLRPEGREHVLPRYHPPWRCAPHRPLIGVALPVLVALAARGPCPLSRAFFRRLRADLHVMHAPGLAPSPGRCRLRMTLLVPSTPFAAPPSSRLLPRPSAGRGPQSRGCPHSVRGRAEGGRPDFPVADPREGDRAGAAARRVTRMASISGPGRSGRITARGAGHNRGRPDVRARRRGWSGGASRCRVP
ncbi:hypothetical protein GZL_06445 [Streptomyces sp. 769]|nr:hypothetical protein GZL_06445 [Streptomyces sp. 769]